MADKFVSINLAPETAGGDNLLWNRSVGVLSPNNVGDGLSVEALEENVTLQSEQRGVPEIFTLTVADGATSQQADTLILTIPGPETIAIWLDIDADGTPPTSAAYMASPGVAEVNILSGDTAAQVAGKLAATAILGGSAEGLTLAALGFTDNLDGTLTFNYGVTFADGPQVDPVPLNDDGLSAGSMSIVIDQVGSLTTPNGTLANVEVSDNGGTGSPRVLANVFDDEIETGLYIEPDSFQFWHDAGSLATLDSDALTLNVPLVKVATTRGALSATLDFSLDQIWTKTLTDPYELALSNSVIGETRMLEVDSDANEAFTLPASCKLLSGTYDDTGVVNYVFIFCNDTDSYLVTISQEQP